MKIYISGQIKGLRLENAKSIFKQAEVVLHNAGFQYVNPLEIDETFEPAGREDWDACMLIDIKHLWDCDGIYMMFNWQESKGARIEHAIAKEMGKKIFYEASAIE
jgi:hypothetical protein